MGMNQLTSTLQGVPLIDEMVGNLHAGSAADIMQLMPDGCIDQIITSPPYWTAVEYDGDSTGWSSYEAYLDDMQRVWRECARVLRPNGRSEEHTSELQSLMRISSAVFCVKKK